MAKVLHGDAGGNQLNASADKTQVYGLKGNDTLVSDGKSDVLLVGGGGDDSLIVMGGQATLSGGDGSDTFELNYSADKKLFAVIEDLQPSEDKIVVNFDGSTTPQLSAQSISGGDVVWSDGDGLFKVTLKSVRDNDYFDGTASVEAWEVLELTNAEREAAGLSPLTMSQGLTEVASIRAQEITELGVLGLLKDHTRRPDDKEKFYTVFKDVGKYYSHFAENLDGGAATPAEVVEQWMGSDAHQKNILNGVYEKLGVGYNYDDPDPTNHRYYWTQEFGDSLTVDSLGNPETVTAANLLTANVEINSTSKFIAGTENPDTIQNSDYGATIDALGGDDDITNAGLNVSISGGSDSDLIINSGSFSTINGGNGDDQINLSDDAKENVIEYAAGDGNDFIQGFNDTSTLKISGNEFTPVTVGSDVIVSVGSDSITLFEAANLSPNLEGTRSKFFIGTENADLMENTIESATLVGLGGNDTLRNGFFRDAAKNNFVFSISNNVTMNGGEGDDLIGNISANVIVEGGAGNDSVENLYSKLVTINGGEGDDSILSQEASYATVNSGSGNDTILNEWAANISVDAGENDDFIFNYVSENVTLDGSAGNDYIYNSYGSNNVTILGGADNDSIYSNGENASIDAGDGDDYISSRDKYSFIDGGAGHDSISNNGGNSTLSGGEGSDDILNLILATWNNSTGSYETIALPDNVTIDAGNGNNSVGNNAAFVSIISGDGNDRITNFVDTRSNSLTGSVETLSSGDNVTIRSGAGSDTINNRGDFVSIESGEGNDSISNRGSQGSISGGADNDRMFIFGSFVTVNGGLDDDNIIFGADAQNNLIEYTAGDGFDTIVGFKANDTLKIGDGEGTYSAQTLFGNVLVKVGTGSVLLQTAAGLDTVHIEGKQSEPSQKSRIVILSEEEKSYENTVEGAIILAHEDNDSITNTGNNVQINSSAGDKLISTAGNNVEINIVKGNVSVTNAGNNVTIKSGADDDKIFSDGDNATIDAGTGSDQISLSSEAQFALLKYTSGDGNDTVWGFGSNDTLDITAKNYSLSANSNDLIVDVDGEAVTLLDAATLSAPVIIFTSSDSIDDNKLITLTEGDDSYNNTTDGATIAALGGNDYISNFVYSSISIDAGIGSDEIRNTGDNATLDGGAGSDSIGNVHGSDVSITGGDGDDYIYNTEGSNASIAGGTGNDTISNGGVNCIIDGADDDDYISGMGDFVSITGGAGNDTLWSNGANNSINGGAGDDKINAGGSDVTIDGAEGNDYIDNHAANSSVFGGAGSDSVWNHVSNATIDAGEDDDYIDNAHENDYVYITAGNGNDSIFNFAAFSTLKAGEGNDEIHTEGSNGSIDAGVGNDSIENSGSLVTIDGGADNDYIVSSSLSANVSIFGNEGEDQIISDGANVTIIGGLGNDLISLSSDATNNLINYTNGDGNDTIWGYSANTTINIAGAKYTTRYELNDLIYNVGEGSIRLKDARDKPKPIIIGESGTSGGSGPGGTTGSSGTGGTTSGQGGNTSGGTSASANSNSDASGGQSASGSSGTSASSGGNGSSGRGNSSSTAGTSITNPITIPETSASTQTRTTTNYNPFNTSVTTTQGTYSGTKMSPIERTYTGGNRIIQHYGSWRKITFEGEYQGAHFDGAGNFIVESSTGHLVFENATDKVINLKDAAGNDFIKAYMSSTAGTVDLRIYSGYQIINGSLGEDLIFAGADGSQLWGNADNVSDTLVGGDGADIFVGGKNEGSDTFQNASAADVVNLNDTTLSDIVSTNTRDGALVISFNTGNTLTVQSTEALSANIIFSDGTNRRFNHATNSWQTA